MGKRFQVRKALKRMKNRPLAELPTFDKLNYFLRKAKQRYKYPDHKDPVYVFISSALKISSASYIASKVRRQEVHKLKQNFFENHIKELKNIQLNILMRSPK